MDEVKQWHVVDRLAKGRDRSSVTSNPAWGITCSFAYRDVKPELKESKWLMWACWIENAGQTKTAALTFWISPWNVKTQWWYLMFGSIQTCMQVQRLKDFYAWSRNRWGCLQLGVFWKCQNLVGSGNLATGINNDVEAAYYVMKLC